MAYDLSCHLRIILELRCVAETRIRTRIRVEECKVDADPGEARVRNADGCRSRKGQDQEGRWEESV